MLPTRSKKRFKFCNREIRYFFGKQVAFKILQCVYDMSLVTRFSVIAQATKIYNFNSTMITFEAFNNE